MFLTISSSLLCRYVHTGQGLSDWHNIVCSSSWLAIWLHRTIPLTLVRHPVPHPHRPRGEPHLCLIMIKKISKCEKQCFTGQPASCGNWWRLCRRKKPQTNFYVRHEIFRWSAIDPFVILAPPLRDGPLASPGPPEEATVGWIIHSVLCWTWETSAFKISNLISCSNMT